MMSRRRRVRRFWSDDEKRQIVAQTRVPGVSVSRIARRYDVNANLVFKWLRDPRYKLPDVDGARFLPVEVVPSPLAPVGVDDAGQIEIALASGHRLTLTGGFDVGVVLRLAKGLAS
jgi:transposase